MPTTSSFDRRSFLRYSGLALGAVGGSALLSACGGGSSSSSSAGSSSGAKYGTVAVQLSWIKNIEFAGEFFATTKGYYSSAGFSSVNLVAGGSSGTSAESALATGKAFCGLSSPNVTAPAINQGAPLKIVGSTYQKNPFAILSLGKDPIHTPQDMVGKKIGVQSGGNELIFNALLTANGIKPSDVSTVPVQYDPTVLTTGECQGYVAYITNEPILLQAKGIETATFLFADYKLPLLAETFTVTQDTIDNDRAKLKAFLKAEIQGWKDAIASPADSAKLAVDQFGKDQNLDVAEQTKEATAQNALIVSADTQANGLFTVTDQLIQENVAALATAGTTIAATKLFDMSVLAEVYQENPSLKAS